MAEFEQKELTGALFQNDSKEKTDKSPSMRGKIKIKGVLYFVSAFTNLTKENKKWLKLLAKPADEVIQQKTEVPPDDLPFR